MTEITEQRLNALIKEHESERSRRLMAEGALGSERQSRLTAQLARLGETSSPADDVQSPAVAQMSISRPRIAAEAAKLKRAKQPGEAA